MVNKNDDSISGGLTDAEKDSDDVRRGFDFLKKTIAGEYPHLKNLTLVKAETQVVAGYNLYLFCKYEDADMKKNLKARIYVDLSEQHFLDELDLDVK